MTPNDVFMPQTTNFAIFNLSQQKLAEVLFTPTAVTATETQIFLIFRMGYIGPYGSVHIASNTIHSFSCRCRSQCKQALRGLPVFKKIVTRPIMCEPMKKNLNIISIYFPSITITSPGNWSRFLRPQTNASLQVGLSTQPRIFFHLDYFCK